MRPVPLVFSCVSRSMSASGLKGRERRLELRSGEAAVEDAGAGSEEAAAIERACVDRVEAEGVEHLGDQFRGCLVVTGDRERPPSRCARRPAMLLELVVADVVEGLDEAGAVEVLRDDLT